jgi:hypothetical protein
MKLNIEIDNVSEGQAKAIEDMLAVWLLLVEKKKGRWVSMFINGTAGFNPEVTINGNVPERYLENIGPRWNKINEDTEKEDEVYFLDYERIEQLLENKDKNDS